MADRISISDSVKWVVLMPTQWIKEYDKGYSPLREKKKHWGCSEDGVRWKKSRDSLFN